MIMAAFIAFKDVKVASKIVKITKGSNSDDKLNGVWTRIELVNIYNTMELQFLTYWNYVCGMSEAIMWVIFVLQNLWKVDNQNNSYVVFQSQPRLRHHKAVIWILFSLVFTLLINVYPCTCMFEIVSYTMINIIE